MAKKKQAQTSESPAPVQQELGMYRRSLTDESMLEPVSPSGFGPAKWRFPSWPLDAPGMSPPGDDFVRYAVAMGDQKPVFKGTGKDRRLLQYGPNLEEAYNRALYEPCFTLNIFHKAANLKAVCVPGHIWDDPCERVLMGMNGSKLPEVVYGPSRQCRVMVVGKFPGYEEIASQRNFIGPSGQLFKEVLEDLGSFDHEEWYVTNLVKWGKIDPRSDTLAQAWIKDCLPILAMEMRLVRPDYILLLGAEAVSAVLGKGTKLATTVGQVLDYPIDMRRSWSDPEDFHVAKVMTCSHPARVLHDSDVRDQFTDELGMFLDLLRGADVGKPEEGLDHRVIKDEASLISLVDEILAEPVNNTIAVDCEWHGEQPQEEGAYLRTVQVSWGWKKAACIVLRGQGGVPCAIEFAKPHLIRLLSSTPERKVRIIGHFLRADLPWLVHYGIDLRPEFLAPEDDQDPSQPGQAWGFEKTKWEGGFDTGLAAHSINEAAGGQGFKLEVLGSIYLRTPRYDAQLIKWKKGYCKEHKLTEEQLEGYGECPDEILHPYATYDADLAYRLFCVFNGREGVPRHGSPPGKDLGLGLLDEDKYGLCSREPFWITMRASPAFLEMEMVGAYFDRPRAEDLTEIYRIAKEKRLLELRTMIKWPEFNPASDQHRKELLFGEDYSGKKDKLTGRTLRIRPDDAVSLMLTPIKTTGKPSKDWAKVVARRETYKYNPSCDKEVLSILGVKSGEAALLRDVRFLSHIFNSVLRLPKTKDGVEEVDDDGQLIYEKGLISCVGWDGRIRTHFFQTKETGRASSARPPLQNLGKNREDDYRRILGSDYKYALRSMLRAAPGCVLIEADYSGAEVAVAAWMADDPLLMDHARRMILDEKDPDYYDVHSAIAVEAFQLKVTPQIYTLLQVRNTASGKWKHSESIRSLKVGDLLLPTKACLKAADFSHLRTAAKRTIFGYFYGQGPESAARKAKEDSSKDITADDCQALMDRLEVKYPYLVSFFDACRGRVYNAYRNAYDEGSKETAPGWMCNCFGRYRRFKPTTDRQATGEAERQAMNFPVQCLRRGSFVATRNGYARIESLVGKPGAVYPCTFGAGLGVAVESSPKECIRLRTSRGLPLYTSSGHVFFVYEDGQIAEKQAAQLRPGDWLVESHERLEGGTVTCRPEEAYLLGLLIGDGSFQPACRGRTRQPYAVISTSSYEYASLVLSMCRDLYGVGSMQKDKKGRFLTYKVALPAAFRAMAVRLGLVHSSHASTKRVPDEWLTWSVELRAALLAGLLDAEGEFRVDQRSGSAVTFTNTSQDVAQKVYLLWSSLGYAPCWRGPYPNGKYHDFYRVVISGKQLWRVDGDVPCRHPSWVDYSEVPLRNNGVLPPELIRNIGSSLHCQAAWSNKEHAYIRRMRVKGHGTPEVIGCLLEKAVLSEPLLAMRFDELVEAEPTGETDAMFDVSIIDGSKPAFGANGLLVHNSGIADAMSRALDYIYHYRDSHPHLVYRIILQIHDAVLLEVPVEHAHEVWMKLLPECMVDRVPIYPCYLDGQPTGKGPYRLGISRDCYLRWGEEIQADEARAIGLPEYMWKKG